jgi:hypothetical protein
MTLSLLFGSVYFWLPALPFVASPFLLRNCRQHSPGLHPEAAMPDDRRTEHVTLGCGTLILIALIVLFFSRPGLSDLERDVRALRSEMGELKKALESQTNEIKRMREMLNKLQPGKAAEPKRKE